MALTVLQLVPRLESGGAERSTIEIAQALVAAGHRAIVVSAGGRLVDSLRRAGAEHVTLDLARKSPVTLWRVVALRRLIRDLKPDIVHARSRLPAWIAWLALRGLSPRPHFVTTMHGLNSVGWYSAIMTRGERVIVVARGVREFVREHYPDVPPSRLVVIPRGIAVADFPRGHAPDAAWRARFAASHPQFVDRPLLLLPARGTRLKGHHEAIALLATLHQRYGIAAGLWLLGAREPGRERYVAELEALAVARGVAAFVAIDPPRHDVRDAIARADLVLQLSNKPESFGRTVVESLAIGTPVLGFAHGGVGELLGDLFPDGAVAFGDEDALAARAAQLLRAPPAIAPVTRYRLDEMQASTLALYESLVAESARGRAA